VTPSRHGPHGLAVTAVTPALTLLHLSPSRIWPCRGPRPPRLRLPYRPAAREQEGLEALCVKPERNG